MAEWRLARGWTEAELATRLDQARRRPRNFDIDAPMTPERGWNSHYSSAIIAREPSGSPQPGGPFERAWPFLAAYQFSDPRIVRGHFDSRAELLGRVMVLEAKVLGLRYLGSVIVGALRDDHDAERSHRGFRYDTLEGHFERGSEWFVLSKDHRSGDVTLTIHARWQPGDLPNVWSRIGFHLVAGHYQRAWHRLAHLRMRALIGSSGLPRVPRGHRLVHTGPDLPVGSVHATASGPLPEPIRKETETPAAPRTPAA